jgi:hypothetical protein
MPLSAVDTSWKVGKGFNLAEAKALIEFCTALDYGVDVPPDPRKFGAKMAALPA